MSAKTFKVVIDGFKSLKAAEEFYQWYSGQGEQDIDIWWECRQDEGEEVGETPYITNEDKVKIGPDTVEFTVRN